jgi:hypothetical protein
MVPKTALVLLAHAGADIEDMIAALCLVATVSHALREFKRRDDAVDAAAELATRVGIERERIDAGLAKSRRL